MSRPVPIALMSGAGNSFVVIGPEGRDAIADLEAWTRLVCRRGVSIGADGVLLVEPGSSRRIDVRFLNPDGSRAFCGNGSRCAARYAVHRGWSASSLTLATDIGDVPATVVGDDVTLSLPPARDLGPVECVVDGSRIAARFVDAGVPHLVLPVADVAAAPLGTWGPALRRDPRFGPAGTNVDLVQTLEDDRLLVRTWERGVEGETLACGSAAVAAAAARAWSSGVEDVTVVPASGMPLRLRVSATAISLAGDARVLLEGDARAEATAGG